MRKLTTEDFVAKAKAVYGDKYDYSKVEYVNTKTKVCIVCSKHGDFWKSPEKHLSGQGCEKCFRESLRERYSLGKETFIERANAVFNGFYDYSEVEYVNASTSVKIKCPLHGFFMQNPNNHLKGHGCRYCAITKNTETNTKWTFETCYDEAKKYKTRKEFRKKAAGAYIHAWKKGFLDRFDWFEEIKKPKGYWTKEKCEEESHKYQSRSAFQEGSPTAYAVASRNHWIEDYVWLLDKRLDIVKGKIDSVYVYVFENTKTAYVGRTLIRRQKKRDKEHIFNLDNDNVARYAKMMHVPVPPMQILETNLTLEEGLAREDYWRKWYENQGYTMLNRLATGIGRGSLGGISHGKWNRKACFCEAKKYKSASEFEKMSPSAYSAARINGWLSEYKWFDVLWEAKWDKEACYNEAKKYKSRGEFQRGSRGAYVKALEKGWIDDYTWLYSRQTKPAGYWDSYEHCFEEAKRYKDRRRFQKGCKGAYKKALKNGWLDDYTWFEEKKKPNGYWNQETCYEEAKKYHNRTEFSKHAKRAYQLAIENGWIDEYTWFMPLTGFWTYETCKAEANKYEKRSHFKKGAPGAYTKSRINGWLDEFFPKKENGDK